MCVSSLLPPKVQHPKPEEKLEWESSFPLRKGNSGGPLPFCLSVSSFLCLSLTLSVCEDRITLLALVLVVQANPRGCILSCGGRGEKDQS